MKNFAQIWAFPEDYCSLEFKYGYEIMPMAARGVEVEEMSYCFQVYSSDLKVTRATKSPNWCHL